MPADELATVVSLGELALDGRLVPVAGALPAAVAAACAGSGGGGPGMPTDQQGQTEGDAVAPPRTHSWTFQTPLSRNRFMRSRRVLPSP